MNNPTNPTASETPETDALNDTTAASVIRIEMRKMEKSRNALREQRMVQLRWLIVTWESEHWDDRDKEYYTNSGKYPPKLQFFDGKVWSDVTTVEIPREQLNAGDERQPPRGSLR